MNDQRIISEDDLEGPLTDVWEKMSIDLLQSAFHE
jgi:hypothetical protein